MRQEIEKQQEQQLGLDPAINQAQIMMFLQMHKQSKSRRLEGQLERENRLKDTQLELAEHLLMHLIRDRSLIETGDRVRVQIDREAEVMILRIEIAEPIAKLKKREVAQIEAIKAQTDSED